MAADARCWDQHRDKQARSYLCIIPTCNLRQSLFLDAEQLIERQICRNIQYCWIFRLIFRQNTVRLCTSRQPADGHPEGSERPWSTSMKPEKVHVKGTHGRLLSDTDVAISNIAGYCDKILYTCSP